MKLFTPQEVSKISIHYKDTELERYWGLPESPSSELVMEYPNSIIKKYETLPDWVKMVLECRFDNIKNKYIHEHLTEYTMMCIKADVQRIFLSI